MQHFNEYFSILYDLLRLSKAMNISFGSFYYSFIQMICAMKKHINWNRFSIAITANKENVYALN